MKIIQIDGIRGLITAAFMGVCLFAGFALFPGWVAMNLWNKYLVAPYMFPELNLLQGVLLWAIIVISYCIVSKKGLAVSFRNSPELSDDELKSIVKRAKVIKRRNVVPFNLTKSDLLKDEFIKSAPKDEKESSFVSSPLSLNRTKKSEDKEEETVSNMK